MYPSNHSDEHQGHPMLQSTEKVHVIIAKLFAKVSRLSSGCAAKFISHTLH